MFENYLDLLKYFRYLLTVKPEKNYEKSPKKEIQSEIIKFSRNFEGFHLILTCTSR